jgi:hypothetical protein
MEKETKLFFDSMYSEKSRLNLPGKIILTPLILFIGVIWIILDFLFFKKETG